MRIGIDARLWNQTGVGRYIRNLVWNLQEIDTNNEYVLFVPSDIQQKDLKPTKRWEIVPTDIRWHTVEEQLVFYKVLENEMLDLVHFPYFSVPLLYNRPFVITIHDLIIHHFPTGRASTLPLPIYYAKRFAYKYVLNQAAKKAKRVITVSKATKEEIVKHLRVPEEKVVVTYEGVFSREKGERARGKKNISLPFTLNAFPYFLYVGNAYPHKNVERLIEAFSLVAKKSSDIQLVIVGKENYFTNRIKEKVTIMHLQDRVLFTGSVSDDVLSSLYRHAEALILPSLMEGFGLPGLEAMKHNCPVLASDIPTFREIYKDAAHYFDPYDIISLEKAISHCRSHKDDAAYKAKIRKGLELVKTFSWRTMAEQTRAVYESCISL